MVMAVVVVMGGAWCGACPLPTCLLPPGVFRMSRGAGRLGEGHRDERGGWAASVGVSGECRQEGVGRGRLYVSRAGHKAAVITGRDPLFGHHRTPWPRSCPACPTLPTTRPVPPPIPPLNAFPIGPACIPARLFPFPIHLKLFSACLVPRLLSTYFSSQFAGYDFCLPACLSACLKKHYLLVLSVHRILLLHLHTSLSNIPASTPASSSTGRVSLPGCLPSTPFLFLFFLLTRSHCN